MQNIAKISRVFIIFQEVHMKHIKIVAKKPLWNIDKEHDCRACQTPCKSACKTSVTVGNQVCEVKKPVKRWIW